MLRVHRAVQVFFSSPNLGKQGKLQSRETLNFSSLAAVALLSGADLLRSLAHAPTRESFHRVVVVLLVITGVLIAATLLALAVRLPLEAMLAG